MENKYPIGGYAPGNYQCRCVTCNFSFFGDKRAVQCESCAIKDKEQFDALSPEEQDELIKRNTQLANEMLSGKLTPEQIEDPEALTIDDYEAVLADQRRLVRELDVIINGENAAKQASLVDMVCQIRDLWEEVKNPSPTPSKESDAVEIFEFTEWAAEIAWFDEEYRLWNFYEEEKSVDGQFRFTTKEFYQLFLKQKEVNP